VSSRTVFDHLRHRLVGGEARIQPGIVATGT